MAAPNVYQAPPGIWSTTPVRRLLWATQQVHRKLTEDVVHDPAIAVGDARYRTILTGPVHDFSWDNWFERYIRPKLPEPQAKAAVRRDDGGGGDAGAGDAGGSGAMTTADLTPPRGGGILAPAQGLRRPGRKRPKWMRVYVEKRVERRDDGFWVVTEDGQDLYGPYAEKKWTGRVLNSVERIEPVRKDDGFDPTIFDQDVLYQIDVVVQQLADQMDQQTKDEAIRLRRAAVGNVVAMLKVPLDPRYMQRAIGESMQYVDGINDTTRDLLRDTLRDTIQRAYEYVPGEGLPSATQFDFAREIRSQWDGLSVDRAETIARTEYNTAASSATFYSYKEQGIAFKRWFTVGDGAVCPICDDNAADGELPIDNAFASGDDYPPAHPNCRCNVASATGVNSGEEIAGSAAGLVIHKYSPDQDRDERGRFGSGGGSGDGSGLAGVPGVREIDATDLVAQPVEAFIDKHGAILADVGGTLGHAGMLARAGIAAMSESHGDRLAAMSEHSLIRVRSETSGAVNVETVKGQRMTAAQGETVGRIQDAANEIRVEVTDPETSIGSRSTVSQLQAIAKYSDDQERDDHGRFSGPGGGSDPLGPASIASSLAEAGRAHAASNARTASALDALPIGYQITGRGGSKARTYTRTDLAGDPFWIDDKGAGLTSDQLHDKLGGDRLEPHIGPEALGREAGPGIPRSEMPQINSKDMPEFLSYMSDRGYTVTDRAMPANALRPAQGDYNPAQAAQISTESRGKPIVISRENVIIDGTHRWGRQMQENPKGLVDVHQIDAPIHEALNVAREFPKAGSKTIDQIGPTILKYSDDQERDDHGRFAAGGGSFRVHDEKTWSRTVADGYQVQDEKFDLTTTRSLIDYIGGGYKSWNLYLRTGDPLRPGDVDRTIMPLGDEELTPVKDNIANMDKITHGSALPENTAGFRGLESIGSDAAMFKAGAVFTDKGFGSVALNPAIARSFANGRDAALIRINMPAGQHIGFGRPDESEVILPRDTSYRVDRVERPDPKGPRFVMVTVVDSLAKYSEDQERDDHGRFAGPGGGGGDSVSGVSTPDEDMRRVLAGNTFIDQGDSRIMAGSGEVQERIAGPVKQSTAAAVGARLAQDPRFKDAIAARYAGSPAAADMTDARSLAVFSTARIAEMNNAWANTSSDSDPTSLAMQLAAATEFKMSASTTEAVLSRGHGMTLNPASLGIPESYTDGRSITSSEAAKVVYDKEGGYTRPALRAMYDETQSQLKAAGIEKLTLYRGIGIPSQPSPLVPEFVQQGGVGDFTQHPLSSWTTSYPIAQSFAMDAQGAGRILTATFPASRILSTPRSGLGCLKEYEVVVLAGEGQMRVEKLYDPVNSRASWASTTGDDSAGLHETGDGSP